MSLANKIRELASDETHGARGRKDLAKRINYAERLKDAGIVRKQFYGIPLPDTLGRIDFKLDSRPEDK